MLKNMYWIVVLRVFTHEVAVEAVAELKHARSVGQRTRDVEGITAWNTEETN